MKYSLIHMAQVAWVGFNMALGTLYGFLHQGALVSALSALADSALQLRTGGKEPLTCGEQETDLPRDAIERMHVHFYRTYMPPRHLLQLPPNSAVTVVDHTSDSQALHEAVANFTQETSVLLWWGISYFYHSVIML